ncbi:hypothetical protein PENTCL1PPCAC_6263 [Pristionchus entomophagus]|uniref:Ras-related protein Rab-21 n=1 Tax=Pristionchus entomophagus TaxID=358040 RepID=A0AAV5SU07_9BILA|nr:hypothetical protein PENTCL1PPCAC_6263 [Pristionchus entomophagus]
MDPSGAGTSNDEFKFKVVLLGEGAVGKSSLMLRYVQGNFNPRHISTIQASFLSKQLVVDGADIDLSIWDTAGQEKYHALGPIYYRGSHGALLVYDVTDAKSFDKVKMWVKELRRALGDDVVLFIVGNKVDLADSRTVETEMATQFATSVGATYEETSAKENIGVENLFELMCSAMVSRARAGPSNRGPSPNGGGGGTRRIRIVDEPTTGRKCC